MKKPFRPLLTILLVVGLLPMPSSGQGQVSGPPYPVYVPLVTIGDASTLAMIEKAAASGQITHEQGLLYQAYAVWGDARLPAQYKGSLDANAGDGVMRSIAAEFSGLSAASQSALAPFFLPPNQAGSWWQGQHAADLPADPAADTWQPLSAAGGKMKIWYYTGYADGAAQAAQVKAAVDGRIWQGERDLMNRDPKFGAAPLDVVNVYLAESYNKLDGTVVPFDGTRGVTLSTTCFDTPSWVYINRSRPIGDENNAGIIQTVAHELFHVFQNSYVFADCHAYDWLSEATAKWVEDHLYSKANSEWPYAEDYLNAAALRLDKTGNGHEYGAYLLPYYLTHQFNDPLIVRRMWENAHLYANSYLAVKNALPADKQDSFWGAFLFTLWNKAPYSTFFKDKDSFTGVVKPEWAQPKAVSAPNQELIAEMSGSLPTGAVRYYPFSFPDRSVRSLSFINGLTFNVRQDSVLNGPFSAEFQLGADQTYISEPDPPDFDPTVVLFAMYKRAGQSSWEALPLVSDVSHYCVDTQGPLEDLVVFLSNGDFEHPERVVTPPGLNSRLYASNLPCGQYTGTSSVSYFNAGVTYRFAATSLLFKSESTADYSVSNFPLIDFYQQSAAVSWSISGTDGIGCSYSGSGSFTVGAHPGAGSDRLLLYSGVLQGSPSYRAYVGAGSPDANTEVTYMQTCPDGSSTSTYTATNFLEIPFERSADTLVVPASGALKGKYHQDDGYGNYTDFEWDLTPGP